MTLKGYLNSGKLSKVKFIIYPLWS